jgi:hypothetical protein
MNKYIITLITILTFISNVALAGQVPGSFTYEGIAYDGTGINPLTSTVDFTLGIYSPQEGCLLYEETQTGINLGNTNGGFVLQVGNGRVTANDPGLGLLNVFSNTGSQLVTQGPNCSSGYSPQAGDARQLKVTMSVEGTGTSTTLSPDIIINSVPNAMVASTLQGLGPSSFIQNQNTVSQSNLTSLTNGSDASAFHNHDSRYVQIGAAPNFSSVSISGPPTTGSSAVNLTYLNSVLAGLSSTYAPFGYIEPNATLSSAGSMSALDKTNLTNLVTASSSYATQTYVNSQIAASTPTGVVLANGSVPFTASQSLGGFNLTNLNDPINAQDATTKNWVTNQIQAAPNLTPKVPTATIITTSGCSTTGTSTCSGGKYFPPAGVRYLDIKIVGGGGGGAGAGLSGQYGGNGAPGGTTSFGSLLSVTGGGGASGGTVGSGAGCTSGGVPSISSPAVQVDSHAGSYGGGAAVNISSGYSIGGQGGSSPFQGAGLGAVGSNESALPNSGSGGSGGGNQGTAGNYAGGGGCSGGHLEAIVPNPLSIASSFPYSVATGGNGGAGGQNGSPGGNGGSGQLVILEVF